MQRSLTGPRGPGGRSDNPEQTILVFQGGGALGAYQAGVYEALHDAGVEPDWIIGTSIGAINACLIAGNDAGQTIAETARVLAAHGSQSILAPIGGLAAPVADALVLEYRWATASPDSSSRTSRVLGSACPSRSGQRRVLLDFASGTDAAGADRLLPGRSVQAASDRRSGARAHKPDALFR